MLQGLSQSEKYCGYPVLHKIIFTDISHSNFVYYGLFVGLVLELCKDQLNEVRLLLHIYFTYIAKVYTKYNTLISNIY